MGLFDFVSDEEKKEIEKTNEGRKKALEDIYRKQGKSEYEVERLVEVELMKPDALQHYEAGDKLDITKVSFYFSKEEMERFGKIFKVLTYVENNCNQNWLLFGLIDLIEEGPVQVDYSEKKVRLSNQIMHVSEVQNVQ